MSKFHLFSKVGKTRIVPIGFKILLIFISIIVLSNVATNVVTIQLSQSQIITLNNTIMVDQLKDLYTNASNQYQIYQISHDLPTVENSLKKSAESGFEKPNSVALAVGRDGKIRFMVCANKDYFWSNFADLDALAEMNSHLTDDGISEGSISFNTFNGEYFGVYKYQKDWDYFLIRAEFRNDTKQNTKGIYIRMGILIAVMTLVFVVIGYIIIQREFRTVRSITNDLYDMNQKKELRQIDLSEAPNDDVTYLAASFNSLSSSVNNLLGTFKKFVSKDVVAKAYTEQGVALEGKQQELVMLFSDIKSFTYRTETLGNDIIDVLNVHYNRVIRKVHENSGVIGSIIGDAVLAVYGTLKSNKTRSYDAICSAWEITRATAFLRESMIQRRKEIEEKRSLTESEERIFEAVMLDVGVGIDGGTVFYGNIGSNEHMANTVIGDNVNSASRLEGLTRVYHLPVIVSSYIKDEVEKENSRFKFYEIDTVQVKGKTEGKKIFFPLDTEDADRLPDEKYEMFETGLEAYYNGEWSKARKSFKACELEMAQVFLERMGNKSAPADWSGIWTMTSK
ncbi:MAG: adenylate/guanylate cyclase domain-containing protein [Treponema sp.]|nr:adenylate/guanylate cyclase domain-containing protein [Treponema sp.]